MSGYQASWRVCIAHVPHSVASDPCWAGYDMIMKSLNSNSPFTHPSLVCQTGTRRCSRDRP